MADNVILDPGSGGSTVRTKDRTGIETQIFALDLNPAGSETLMSGAMPITDNGGSLTVDAPVGTPVAIRLSDGTSFIATLPISAASLPLPSGASTAAKQPALGTAGVASSDIISIQGIASMTPIAVSAASLPLPSGASTAAKQPALGTAGAASSDVLSIQGIASMTALKVDPSAVTSPVSLAALPALAAGTNQIGTVTTTPGTGGGWTPKVFTGLTNTKVLINGAACNFGGHLTIYNPNVTVAYIQVFDAATTAAVTLGSTAPTALIIVPAGSAANVEISNGVHMASGIVIAATTTATGSTAMSSTLDGTLLYK